MNEKRIENVIIYPFLSVLYDYSPKNRFRNIKDIPQHNNKPK
jgi:hypothetical protein